jgi:signal transduction histidine kinase
MGGRLVIESAEDVGTRVSVVLPATVDQEVTHDRSSA